MSLAAVKVLEVEQMDVKTTFLHGELEKQIYMRQPEGYACRDTYKDKVCLLKKSLYGLRQDPRQWNLKFDEFMHRIGFTKSSYDPCVYYDNLLFLLLYVDDILLVGKSKDDINRIKLTLKFEFDMKDLGPAKKILGIDIERHRPSSLVLLKRVT